MTRSLPAGLTDSLLWSEENGMGFHPRPPRNYGGPYFKHYQELDASPMGAALTKARVEMVRRHYDGLVLDIGIGGGRFVRESGGVGYDVNPEALAWLIEHGKYWKPHVLTVDALCFWDSLEHIPDPEDMVRQAGEWCFVSMPVYADAADVLRSKHYKPGEHIWYWTKDGLIRWFGKQGFFCVEVNTIESDLGRDGIMSFAFKRHGDGPQQG